MAMRVHFAPSSHVADHAPSAYQLNLTGFWPWNVESTGGCQRATLRASIKTVASESWNAIYQAGSLA